MFNYAPIDNATCIVEIQDKSYNWEFIDLSNNTCWVHTVLKRHVWMQVHLKIDFKASCEVLISIVGGWMYYWYYSIIGFGCKICSFIIMSRKL